MEDTIEQAKYTIQQAADLCGLPSSTLRYYESIGLIAPPTRMYNGHRRYTDSDLANLNTIACLNATGLPIESMREYLDNASRADASAEIAILEEHAARLARELRTLQLRMRYVELKTAWWRAFSDDNQQQLDALGAQAQAAAKELKASLEGEE